MKRDRKLILMILRYFRDSATIDGFAQAPDFNTEFTTVQTNYHVDLCEEAGFIVRTESREIRSRPKYRLTWQGHEELDEACS